MISFALKMFDEIGVNQDDRGENALVLTPGITCWSPASRACRKMA